MDMKSGKLIWPLLAASIALSACSGSTKLTPLEQLQTQGPQEIFQAAEKELADNNADTAAVYFGEVERLYPYSEWAQRALIMSAFAHHEDGAYEFSRTDAQRYLDFYPASKDAAYAQYLIALSYYDQIDNVSRDQGVTFQALQSLRTVIERYPDSDYATSSLLKFDLALDHLAGKEMEIGRYYLKRGHFGAAINRFRVVVEDFQTTSHTPEALHRLVEAYLSLGFEAEAQTAGAILGHNFQNTTWFNDSHVLLTERGLSTEAGDTRATRWLATIWRRVIQGKWL
ncbi:outer membrane protein assembly factor BamD [Amylibacter marinus]|uniref:Outer membrane protein assembly factor BamD n=1 Tax=Amylibacter marinus TaxID=1475483 RepID=A0ABQ5VU65_9RHOB|nr:outer membrane protein assembly factor BamD [Amylibacter marinus]GLQ34860.1 outer membrane protein assembly factor BamD [Amylibacter marinus]